jgi:beta-barrel assembly-enhancing protease
MAGMKSETIGTVRAHARRLASLLLASVLIACASVPPADVPDAPEAAGAPPTPSAPAVAEPVVVPVPVASTTDIRTLETLVAAQDRLYRVAAPLLVNNAELCRNHSRNLLGFTAKNRYSYSSDLVDAAQVVLGVDERLRVTAVLSGSGAARAGIQRGDILVSVEGKGFPPGEHAERQTAALLAPLVAERKRLKLEVLRGSAMKTLDVPLTRACAFSIEFGNTDLVNAYGDGQRVLLTRGMLGAVRGDEELAFVLAKEISHNILAHAARLNQGANTGAIIDNLVRIQPDMTSMVGLSGLRPLPPDLDAAADRLSFYLLARAGYEPERAIPFWRRMAADYPASMLNTYTALHPSTERRVAAMERALRDIRSKRAAKKPLTP